MMPSTGIVPPVRNFTASVSFNKIAGHLLMSLFTTEFVRNGASIIFRRSTNLT